MGRFKRKDIIEILEFFEKELDSLRNIDRIEKMKMRSKIRKQGAWLMAFRNPTTLKITDKLEENLFELFRMHHSGFKDKFKEIIKKKVDGLSKV